jgi:hypothetical protein
LQLKYIAVLEMTDHALQEGQSLKRSEHPSKHLSGLSAKLKKIASYAIEGIS